MTTKLFAKLDGQRKHFWIGSCNRVASAKSVNMVKILNVAQKQKELEPGVTVSKFYFTSL